MISKYIKTQALPTLWGQCGDMITAMKGPWKPFVYATSAPSGSRDRDCPVLVLSLNWGPAELHREVKAQNSSGLPRSRDRNEIISASRLFRSCFSCPKAALGFLECVYPRTERFSGEAVPCGGFADPR